MNAEKIGGGFNRDPHHADVVGRDSQQHRGDEQVDENVVAAQVARSVVVRLLAARGRG